MAGISNRISKYVLLSGVALTASITGASAASAQDAPPAPAAAPAPEASNGLGFGDIVVTAQRRAENVLSVPLSISATKGETLRATNITDVTSLRFNTPGFTSVSGTGYTQIYVRGIGNRISVGADPSVALFIDDVPRTYAAIVDDFTNVERVEVLKGAQGGLYGRNSTGGVINIITRQPNPDKFAAEARVGYGTKKTFDASAYINLPLNDNVAVNFYANRKTHDDYTPNRAFKNPYQTYQNLSPSAAAAYGDAPSAAHPNGQRQWLIDHPGLAASLDSGTHVSHMNNQDFWAFNGKLLFRGDGFKVTLAADYQNSPDSNGGGWQAQYCGDTLCPAAPQYGVYSFLMGGTTGAGVFGAAANGAVLPKAYVFPARKTKYDTLGSIETHGYTKDYGFSARGDIDMPGFVLSSITALRWNTSQFRGDIGVGNVPIAGFQTLFQRRSFYQEIRMVSNASGPFRWLAGATYYHDKINNSLNNIVLGIGFSPTLAQTVTNSFSGYAQGEYNFTEQLKLTASVRYVTEKKVGTYPAQVATVYDPNFDNGPGNPPGKLNNGVALPAASGQTGAHKFLPAVTLSYALPNGGVVYARYAQGLKTGGVNPVVSPGQTGGVVNAFKPEAVTTYEVGLRASLFDRKVQFTTAAFYNDYTNLALTLTGYSGLPFVLFNAKSARTYGAEASVNWQTTKWLSLGANIGYLNAKYTSLHCSMPAPDATWCIKSLAVHSFNNDGKTMIESPKWQGGLTAQMDVPVTDNWNFAGTVLYSFSSKFYNTDSNNPLGTTQKAYSVMNLRAGAHTRDNRLGAYLSIKNVFDKHYQVFGTSSNTANYSTPGAPRIIMGQLELKF
jgi:iron complex outermembrane receptor protein